jgi:hypothetical protein
MTLPGNNYYCEIERSENRMRNLLKKAVAQKGLFASYVNMHNVIPQYLS